MTFLRWDAPGPYEVVFTTRLGGVSDGPYESLNLGRKTGDDVEKVDENRRRACAEIGADAKRLALNYQVHSAVVHRARPGARIEPGDGLWTDEPDVPVLAMSADCIPIALVRLHGAAPAVAVLHVGWRGLLADAIQSAVAPYSFAALTLAFARTTRVAPSTSLRSIASISGVDPSACARAAAGTMTDSAIDTSAAANAFIARVGPCCRRTARA